MEFQDLDIHQQADVKEELRKDPTIYPVKSAVDAPNPLGISEAEYIVTRDNLIEKYIAENSKAKKVTDLITKYGIR